MGPYIKRLLKHIFNYGFATFLTSIISFLLIPIYTRTLTSSDYGIIDLLNTFGGFISILLIFGITTSFTVSFYDCKTEEEIKQKFSIITNFLFLVSGSIILILIVVNQVIGLNFLKGIPKSYVNYMLITYFLGILTQIPLSYLQLKEKSKTYVRISIVQFSVRTGLTLIFLLLFKEKAVGVLKANLIAAVFMFAIAICISKNLYKFVINFKELREMLKIGLPVLPHELSSWGLTFADRMILSTYVNYSALGVYSFAYKIGMIMNVIVSAINQAWFPFFMDTATKKGEGAKTIFSKINKYYFILVGGICYLASMFSNEIVHIMGTKGYYDSVNIIPLILFSYFMQGMYFMNNGSIFYKKKTYLLPVSSGISIAINIVFNLILIPKFGILGAAVANIITYTCFFLIVHIINLKIYGVKLNYKSMILCLGIYVLSYVIATDMFGNFSYINMAVKAVISIATIILCIIMGTDGKEKKFIRKKSRLIISKITVNN